MVPIQVSKMRLIVAYQPHAPRWLHGQLNPQHKEASRKGPSSNYYKTEIGLFGDLVEGPGGFLRWHSRLQKKTGQDPLC